MAMRAAHRQHRGLSGRTPAETIDTLRMGDVAVVSPGCARVLRLTFLALLTENVDSALSSARSQDESVLPGRPRDAIDGFAELLLEHNVLPVALRVLAPHLDLVVIAARCDH